MTSEYFTGGCECGGSVSGGSEGCGCTGGNKVSGGGGDCGCTGGSVLGGGPWLDAWGNGTQKDNESYGGMVKLVQRAVNAAIIVLSILLFLTVWFGSLAWNGLLVFCLAGCVVVSIVLDSEVGMAFLNAKLAANAVSNVNQPAQ